MSNEKQKPRVWKLRPIPHPVGMRMALVIGSNNFEDLEQVVEISALTAAQERIRELEKANLELAEIIGLISTVEKAKQHQALEQQMEKLVGVLEQSLEELRVVKVIHTTIESISKLTDYEIGILKDAKNRLEQALAEYKKWRDRE